MVNWKITFVIFGYGVWVCRYVRSNWEENFRTDLKIERILADVRSVGRLRKSIKDEQKEYLTSAKNRFLEELRKKGYNQEANRIEEVFVSYLW